MTRPVMPSMSVVGDELVGSEVLDTVDRAAGSGYGNERRIDRGARQSSPVRVEFTGEGGRQQAQCGVPTGQLDTTEELSSGQVRGGDLLSEQAQLVPYRPP